MKLKIKTGDDVIVLSGKNKGQKGRIEKVYPTLGMVKVKDVNVVKRHMKPRKAGEKGVIVEINKPIRVSTVSLLADGKATRVRYEMKDKRKVRVSVKTGKEV